MPYTGKKQDYRDESAAEDVMSPAAFIMRGRADKWRERAGGCGVAGLQVWKAAGIGDALPCFDALG